MFSSLNMASFKLANFAIFDSIRANFTEATAAAPHVPHSRGRCNAIRRKNIPANLPPAAAGEAGVCFRKASAATTEIIYNILFWTVNDPFFFFWQC